MFPHEEKITNRSSSGSRDQHPHTILYNILSWRDRAELNSKLSCSSLALNCHCEQRRTVCLKDPKATCQVASGVLVKTISFMRSLPSFAQLPLGDQSSLLRHCWVALFVLGLAQERIEFEVTDVPKSSILRRILLRPGLSDKETDQPTLTGVHRLKTCLRQLWDLDLSPREYAYLKGAMLFNPGKTSLRLVTFRVWYDFSALNSLVSLLLVGVAEVQGALSNNQRVGGSNLALSQSLLWRPWARYLTQLALRKCI